MTRQEDDNGTILNLSTRNDQMPSSPLPLGSLIE